MSSTGNSSVDALVRVILMATPDCDEPHPFSCRIWFREAIRVLIAHSMITGRSVNALEKELVGLADDIGNAVALQGRPWKLFDDLDSVIL